MFTTASGDADPAGRPRRPTADAAVDEPIDRRYRESHPKSSGQS
jgi:hypothetical protein